MTRFAPPSGNLTSWLLSRRTRLHVHNESSTSSRDRTPASRCWSTATCGEGLRYESTQLRATAHLVKAMGARRAFPRVVLARPRITRGESAATCPYQDRKAVEKRFFEFRGRKSEGDHLHFARYVRLASSGYTGNSPLRGSSQPLLLTFFGNANLRHRLKSSDSRCVRSMSMTWSPTRTSHPRSAIKGGLGHSDIAKRIAIVRITGYRSVISTRTATEGGN